MGTEWTNMGKVSTKKYYGKSEVDVKAEVIYDLVTSGELDREEGIATIRLNLELAGKLHK